MPPTDLHPFNSSGPRQRVWISQKAARAVACAALQARIGNRKLLDAVLEDPRTLERAAQALVKRLSRGSRAQIRGKTLKTAVAGT